MAEILIDVQGWRKLITVSDETYRYANDVGYLEVLSTILPLQNKPSVITNAGQLPNKDTMTKLVLKRSSSGTFFLLNP